MESHRIPLQSIPRHNLKQILDKVSFNDFINLKRTNYQLLHFIDSNKELFINPVHVRKLYIHSDGNVSSISPFLEFTEENRKDLVNIRADELHLKMILGPENRERAIEACRNRKIRAKHVVFWKSDFVPEILDLTGAKACTVNGGGGMVQPIEVCSALSKLESLNISGTVPLDEAQLRSLTCRTANFCYERIQEKNVNVILKRFSVGELEIAKWVFSTKNHRPTVFDLDLLTARIPSISLLWCLNSHRQSLISRRPIEELNPRMRYLFSSKNHKDQRIIIKIDDYSITLLNWPSSAGEEFIWNMVRMFK